MKLLFVTALLALVCASTAQTCMSDGDCNGGCCYQSACHNFQNVSEPCHLPNHQVHYMMYPCGCMTGLTCDEIHFDNSLPDPVHQAESLLLSHGYGLCTDTPGQLFG